MIAFLLHLMNDPAEFDAFRQDPVAIMQRYAVTEEDAAAILSGDIEAISTRLAAAGKEQRAFMPKEGATANVRNKPQAHHNKPGNQGTHGHHR
jgi:Aromatic-ring-opening dioxygenase LigAB, LigA subunit